MDEVQRLIMKVEGEEEIKRLNKQLEVQREEVVKLQAAQKAGGVGFNPAQLQAAGAAMVQTTNQIKQLERSTKDYSYTGLQLSYIFDDLANSTGGWERKLASISRDCSRRWVPGPAWRVRSRWSARP